MCLGVSEGLETIFNVLKCVHHTGLVSGSVWAPQQDSLLLQI